MLAPSPALSGGEQQLVHQHVQDLPACTRPCHQRGRRDHHLRHQRQLVVLCESSPWISWLDSWCDPGGGTCGLAPLQVLRQPVLEVDHHDTCHCGSCTATCSHSSTARIVCTHSPTSRALDGGGYELIATVWFYNPRTSPRPRLRTVANDSKQPQLIQFHSNLRHKKGDVASTCLFGFLLWGFLSSVA